MVYDVIEQGRTALNLTLQALNESQENFRTFFDTIDDIVIITNTEGDILHTNPAFTNKLGYDISEIGKLHLLDLHPEASRKEAEIIFEEMLDGKRDFCPLPLQKKNGDYFPVETRVWFGKWSGENCIFGICKDLSKEQEALQKFDRLFRCNPALMAVSSLPDRRFTDVNDSFLSALGYSKDEILGRTGSELGLFVEPQAQEEIARHLDERCFLKDVDLKVRTKDGSILEGLFSGEIIESQGHKSLLTVMVDITKRKQAEHALKKAEEKFRSLFDNSLDGIFITSPDGTIFNANRAACAYLNLTEDQICSSARDFIVDLEDPRLSQALTERERTGKFQGELNFKHENGTVFPVDISSAIIKDKSEPFQAYVIFRDVSERKRLEHERLEMERKSQHLLKLESLGIMAGGIAHDFNNLFHAALGNLELAAMDILGNSEVSHSIQDAVKCIKRASEISGKMLTYSGQAFFQRVELDINHLIECSLDSFKSMISKTVELEVQLQLGIERIMADHDRVLQIINSLLANSSEALGPDYGTVTLSTGVMNCDRVFLSRSSLNEKPAPGKFVFLRVADNGIGIDEKTVSRLFDPFFTTKSVGRGLGLSAVMGIVKAHRGAIIVDSKPGVGTAISVLFPACVKTDVVTSNILKLSDNSPTEKTGLAGRILLVEDEESVRDLAVRMIRHCGYDVITATNGAECLGLFQKNVEDIDIVLMNLVMPKIDGVEALDRMRAIDPGTKIIIMSGFNREQTLGRFDEKKPDGFIQKPYSVIDLREELARVAQTIQAKLSAQGS